MGNIAVSSGGTGRGDVVATVRQIVWDVVGNAVPEERWLLESLESLNDEQVRRAMRRWETGRRGPVRFGLPEVVPFAVPLVWMVVEQLTGHATGKVVDAATTRIGTRVRGMFRRRPTTAPPVPQVDDDTLAWVRRQVLEGAIATGFDAARAEELAEEVVARLRAIDGDPRR